MNSKSVETREDLADGITPEQIKKFIKEKIDAGATSCKVEKENNKNVLVCQWPPL